MADRDLRLMVPVQLAAGFCFGEGPRWFEGLLWFSDMLGEAVHTVDLHGSTSTLPLAGRTPSGLGFRPDGSLLIVSTEDRQVLRYDGDTVEVLVDLTDVVPANLGDMVVDDAGRAYVGSQARDGGVIVRIGADDGVAVVAESTGRRLTAFTIGPDGDLADRRVFADGLDGPPDGLALDAGGGVWSSMTLAGEFQRIVEGGTVTDRIAVAGRIAIACALGGPEGRTLFLLSSTDAHPERLIGTKASRVDAVMVDIPAPGVFEHH